MQKKLVLLSVAVLSLYLTACKTVHPEQDEWVYHSEGIEYFGDIVNPERGFHFPISSSTLASNISTTPTGLLSSTEMRRSLTNSKTGANHGIVYMRLGLEHFSSNAYYSSGGSWVTGTTGPISQNVLTFLNNVMENVRSSGQTAMLRFNYNGNGRTKSHVGIEGSGYIEAEPPMEWILHHINQLKPLFTEYADVIMTVETGFLGPWGEMHGTAMADNPNHVNTVIDAMLNAVPKERTIQVRYPEQYMNWYNAKYGANCTLDTMRDIEIASDSPAGRIGIYNDGYLGSDSDYGTFRSPTHYDAHCRWGADKECKHYQHRVNEIEWIAKHSERTFYGGETGTYQVVPNEWNRIEYLAWEAFKTHTTYLKIDWHPTVINHWKNTPYRVMPLENSWTDGYRVTRTNAPLSGGQSAVEDKLYRDNNATAFQYIRDRLGYRLVLRESANNTNVPANGILKISGKLENVGFGNIVNKKNAYVILISGTDSETHTVLTTLNPNDWTASSPLHDISFSLNLDELGITPGEYDIYLKVNDALEKNPDTSNLRCIRFANQDAGVWNASLGANYLGSTVVL